MLTHLPVISDVASMNECTGLMPTLAETPEEWAAYRQLFSMELPETEIWHRNTAQKQAKAAICISRSNSGKISGKPTQKGVFHP